MKKVLVFYAHPNQKYSQANTAIVEHLLGLPGVTVVDLYAVYPTFKIDIDVEQKRLIEHDIIIFQFPLYWYSTPSILKEWQDVVLEYGFAFGQDAEALKDKYFLASVTTGGSVNAYCKTGTNQNTIRELLQPLERMAQLCQLKPLAPLVLFSASQSIEDGRLKQHITTLRHLIEKLQQPDFDPQRLFCLEQVTCDDEQWLGER